MAGGRWFLVASGGLACDLASPLALSEPAMAGTLTAPVATSRAFRYGMFGERDRKDAFPLLRNGFLARRFLSACARNPSRPPGPVRASMDRRKDRQFRERQAPQGFGLPLRRAPHVAGPEPQGPAFLASFSRSPLRVRCAK